MKNQKKKLGLDHFKARAFSQDNHQLMQSIIGGTEDDCHVSTSSSSSSGGIISEADAEMPGQ